VPNALTRMPSRSSATGQRRLPRHRARPLLLLVRSWELPTPSVPQRIAACSKQLYYRPQPVSIGQAGVCAGTVLLGEPLLGARTLLLRGSAKPRANSSREPRRSPIPEVLPSSVLRQAARTCRTASTCRGHQNLFFALTRRLNCPTSDSTWLVVIGSPCFRARG